MLSGMVAHIYQFLSSFDGLKGSFHYKLRFADEGHDHSVRGLSGVNIQEFDTGAGGYGMGNFLNDLRISSL
jgi:hypothetical protein